MGGRGEKGGGRGLRDGGGAVEIREALGEVDRGVEEGGREISAKTVVPKGWRRVAVYVRGVSGIADCCSWRPVCPCTGTVERSLSGSGGIRGDSAT